MEADNRKKKKTNYRYNKLISKQIKLCKHFSKNTLTNSK